MSLMHRRVPCCNGEDRVSFTDIWKMKNIKKYRLDQVGVRKEPVDGKIEMTKRMHSHELSAVAVSTV